MEDGFIILPRNIRLSLYFAHPVTFKIWIWLMMRARFIAGPVTMTIGKGISVIPLARGQTIIGRNSAAEELGIPPSTFDDHVKKLVEYKAITVKATKNYSIVTMVNYDKTQKMESANADGNTAPVKQKKVPDTHPYKDILNLKTVEEKQTELKNAIYRLNGSIEKVVLDQVYNDLSTPIPPDNLHLNVERYKNFDILKHIREKNAAYINAKKSNN